MNHGYPPPAAGRPGPGGAPPSQTGQRLNELLDQIRQEFETESQRSVDYEDQSEFSPLPPSADDAPPSPSSGLGLTSNPSQSRDTSRRLR